MVILVDRRALVFHSALAVLDSELPSSSNWCAAGTAGKSWKCHADKDCAFRDPLRPAPKPQRMTTIIDNLLQTHHSVQISDAIKRFGVSDQTRSLLVVRVGNIDSCTGLILTDEKLQSNMESAVQGQVAELDGNLSHITDFSQIQKVANLWCDLLRLTVLILLGRSLKRILRGTPREENFPPTFRTT